MNMKKKYVKPVVTDVNIEVVNIIAISGELVGDMNGAGKDNVIFETSDDKRNWGSLWGK